MTKKDWSLIHFVIRSFRHSSFFMSPILGIDLSTTNSLVGVVDSGFPILLADEQW